MLIIYLFIILLIITLLFMYKLFSKSNTINEDDNILQNKINNLENSNQKSLDLFNNYSVYRLGDIFYNNQKKNYWKIDKKHMIAKHGILLENYPKLFPNSILTEYLKLSNYTEKDWVTLIEIVNNKFYRDININKFTHCLMHLRVGDVIDELCSGEHFFNKFYKDITKINEEDKKNIIWCHYMKPLKYFQEKIKKLLEMGITKVYLMAGAHIKLPSYKYSTYYINKIIEEIEKVGLQVELKLGGGPDDDLLFSMNFDYFIPSEGQYCRLIKELNQKINPDFVIL